MTPEALPLDIAARVLVPTSPCWIWRGTRTNKGYATFRATTAYRLVYEAVVGPIPDGYEIDHLCFNPTCVNPEHLEAITGAENNRRSESLSAKRGRQQWCHKGHPFDEENTLHYAGHRRCRACRDARLAEGKHVPTKLAQAVPAPDVFSQAQSGLVQKDESR